MANAFLEAFYSLGKNINKRLGNEISPEIEEGIVSEKFPELKLNMSNDDLGKLTKKWEKTWIESAVYADWLKHGQENEDYWIGKQFTQPKIDKTRALVDNVLFQSLETWLPQVTQHNPEPVVTLDESEDQTKENLDYVTHLKQELYELADEIKMRLKLKKAARHWSIYLVGAVKLGWDMDKDIPTAKVIRPTRLILDPEATVDEDGYTGKFIGEHRKLSADMMLQMLDAVGGEDGAEAKIKELVKEDLGTEVGFIEWWTNEYMCWTLKDTVLLKKKNPHWNYDKEVPAQPDENSPFMQAEGQAPENAAAPQLPAPAPAMPETGGAAAPQISETQGIGETPEPEGEPAEQPQQPEEQEVPEPATTTQEGFNHLAKPSMPYLLLSVFNLGKQPVDETSLMGQNLASQDLINKRLRQIDKNADSMNGGMVVSLARSGLTQQQAKGVTEALRKGGTIAIPDGAVNEAIARMSAPALPNDVYNQLQDTRQRVQYIFGTRGFTPTQGGGQAAVRSQILNKNLDEARISGGFSEYLEQFADDIYNWFIQLLYVYDDDYAGQAHPAVSLTIKEGSILPKDAAAIAAQAIELAGAGRMSLVDLYKKLEYPNPEEMAANVWLEQNAPAIMFENDPRVQKAIQMQQQAAAQAGGKPPSVSVNYKDTPPDAKTQILAKVGIQAHPEALAAHETLQHERSNPQPEPQPVNQLDGSGYVTPQ